MTKEEKGKITISRKDILCFKINMQLYLTEKNIQEVMRDKEDK